MQQKFYKGKEKILNLIGNKNLKYLYYLPEYVTNRFICWWLSFMW